MIRKLYSRRSSSAGSSMRGKRCDLRHQCDQEDSCPTGIRFCLSTRSWTPDRREHRRHQECDGERTVFRGHFPGQPVMPGVLIIEAMAQTGGILLLNGVENPGDKLVFFMRSTNAKFRKPVVPGDQLVFELKMISRKSRICQMTGRPTWRPARRRGGDDGFHYRPDGYPHPVPSRG